MTLRTEEARVSDYMSSLPVFVLKDSSIIDAVNVMNRFNSDNISIIDDNLSIIGTVTKDIISKFLNTKDDSNLNISDVIKSHNQSVVLYQGMSAKEAYNLMKYLQVKGLPVADVPWEKKITGHLWVKDICESLLN